MSDEQSTKMLEILDKQVDALAKVADELSNCVEPFTLGFQQKDLMDNIKLYSIVNYLSSVAKELGRIANVVEPVLAERISKRMLQDDLDSIKYSGYTYTPSEKTYFNITADNKPIVLQWLKTHDRGHELVHEDYNANAFKSFAEKELAEGKKLHPSIGVFSKPTLSTRKAR